MYNQKTNSYGGQVCSYTSKVSEVSRVSGVTKQGEQQSLHSLLPLGEGGRRPDEGLKRRAKDAQSQCPPLEGGPEFSIPRRGSERSELLTPHQGRPACTNTQGIAERNAFLNDALTSGSAMVSENISFCSQSAVQHDKTRHGAAEPASCKSLVPQCLSPLVPYRKAAFTLAEVLITLAVIGIVAVLVLPPLVRNYQSRSWSTASDLFQKRLAEATKQMNTQGQLLGYSSTEDFVNNGLSKYMKIIKKCNKDELDKCFSSKFEYGTEELETSALTSASNFGKDDWTTDPYGIILDNGTTALLVYNKDCSYIDPYNNQVDGTSCLSVAYDVNGMKTPNAINKDLYTMNASLSKYACISKGLLNETGVCLTQSISVNDFSEEDCLKIKDEYGLQYCYTYDCGFVGGDCGDRFAGAVVACGGINHVASEAQLKQIAQYVYKRNDIPDSIVDSNKMDDLVLDAARWREVSGWNVPSSGSAYYIMANEELPITSRYKTRAFAASRTYNSAEKRGWAKNAFCVR